MYTQNKILTFVLLGITCFSFIVSCRIHDDGTLRDKAGHIILATDSEIAENQKKLLNAKYPGDLPETAEGGIVFDGTVTSVQVLKNGLHITRLKIKKVLFGSLENETLIDIYSPSIEKGGIDFKVNEEYRVFVVYLDGAYRTWNWTGTVRIS